MYPLMVGSPHVLPFHNVDVAVGSKVGELLLKSGSFRERLDSASFTRAAR